jgi:hypothetical protein
VTDIVNVIYSWLDADPDGNDITLSAMQAYAADFDDDGGIGVNDVQQMILYTVRCLPLPSFYYDGALQTPDGWENPCYQTATVASTAPAMLDLQVVDGQLEVVLSSPVPVAAVQFELNTTDVNLLGMTKTDALNNMDVFNTNSSLMAVSFTGESFTSTGAIARVAFDTDVDGEISLDNVVVLGADGNPIDVSFVNGSVTVKGLPKVFLAAQNFPNPFNPTTTIQYQLPRAEQVTIRVFNAAGQLVRTLVDAPLEAGYHNVVWDARNDVDAEVSSGVYFYQVTAGEFNSTKRMMLLK